MKALAIRQPWAWAILNAGKDVENRPRPTKIRGRILILASAGMTAGEYQVGAHTIDFVAGKAVPALKDLQRGGIVGSVEIVDCVADSRSPWAFEGYQYVLRDARPMQFIPYKGQLGFFNVPDELVAGTL